MDQQTTSGDGYGKRPLWQWILLYVVLGGIAYGLVYYFVFAKRGGHNYQTPYQNITPNSQQPPPNNYYK